MKRWVLGIALSAGRLGGLWSAGAYFGAAAVVALAAILEKRISPEGAVDRVLMGAVFGWTIPLLSYSAVARVSRYGRLDTGVDELARYGGNRRGMVACFVLMTSARVSIVASLLAALAVLVAASGQPNAIRADAVTSAWIGALGGAAYVAWFSFASLWGRAGRGRLLALLVDWVLGAATSAISVPWPRAHLRSLLGGELVLGMPPWQSSVSLAFLGATYFLACVFRVAR